MGKKTSVRGTIRRDPKTGKVFAVQPHQRTVAGPAGSSSDAAGHADAAADAAAAAEKGHQDPGLLAGGQTFTDADAEAIEASYAERLAGDRPVGDRSATPQVSLASQIERARRAEAEAEIAVRRARHALKNAQAKRDTVVALYEWANEDGSRSEARHTILLHLGWAKTCLDEAIEASESVIHWSEETERHGKAVRTGVVGLEITHRCEAAAKIAEGFAGLAATSSDSAAANSSAAQAVAHRYGCRLHGTED